MRTLATWLIFLVWLLPVVAVADQKPSKGKLLVATELVQGEAFGRTVILLLHYDHHGAMGLVVNRPTDIELEDLVDDVEAVSAGGGTLYYGGPVQMHSLRALLQTDSPPEGSEAIIDSVYLVHIDDRLSDVTADPAHLRFYIGYAGWGAGQLDRELDRGSWHVVAASKDHVFAKEPRGLWKQLTPPAEHRAAAQLTRTLEL